jgi:hypothetical protein
VRRNLLWFGITTIFLLAGTVACVHVPSLPDNDLRFVNQKQVSCDVGSGATVKIMSNGVLFSRGGWLGYRLTQNTAEQWLRLGDMGNGTWQAEIPGTVSDSLRLVDIFTSPRTVDPLSAYPFEVTCK